MLIDILEVKPLDGYKVFIRFEDGISGEIDISKVVPFMGVFSELKDKHFFDQVFVNKETGTICWKNGADISPCSLYDILTHR